MGRLNLLMLNYEFPPIGGGAANAHLHLLKEYAGNGELSVDVLTSGPKPEFFREEFSDNVTIYKVGIHKKDLHYWRKIEVIEWLVKSGFHYRRLLRENSYDLVHAFFGFPTGWLCYRTAHKLPYIISLRGSDVPGQNARLQREYKILAPVFRSIWKKATALVTNSEGAKSRALRFLPSVDIDVIANGIDLERFYPAEQPEHSSALRLVTVGRLSVTKRVDMLIEAVRILRDSGCMVTLSVVGGGGLEAPLRELIEQKSLVDAIELTGRIEAENMPDWYRRHGMFVSATMQEGMSNAMLEAMASGLPIVTTKCEGLDELIEYNGIIVEQDNAESIAEAIKQIVNDRDKWLEMRTAARKQAGKFTWNSVAEAYLVLYEKVSGRVIGQPKADLEVK